VTYVAGNAVRRAATSAREQLILAAAAQQEVSPDDLEVRDGRVCVKGAPAALGGGVLVGDVARRRLYQPGGGPIVGLGEWDNPSEFPDETRYGNESGAYNFVAETVEVEVDPETGQVTVVDMAAAVDCGTVLNPTLAEGQVEGGIAHGLGLALSESFAWSDGRPQNPNFGDYKLPTVGDMPPLHVAFADSYEPSGPFGAKGVGEISLDPVPAAIANAIHDAVGVRIYELPITAEKVQRALRERQSQT
jgi:CO/xanthine dehydrogenase Mo-binding subunit